MTDLRIESYEESYPPELWAPPVIPATGATAGIPGTWTPSGSTPPATVGDMGGIVATPATAWTVGQYVQTQTVGAAGQTYWNGTAWVAGTAPLADEPEPSSAPEPETDYGEPVPIDELPPE